MINVKKAKAGQREIRTWAIQGHEKKCPKNKLVLDVTLFHSVSLHLDCYNKNTIDEVA